MYFTAQPANPSTLKQVDLSIAWSLKIFLHLKWTSDQEGCVAKFEKKLSRNIYFIWAPDFLTGLAGLPRYSLASAKYSSFPPNPPLNQSLSCAMAKRIGYNIYIHTWIDFLWMTSINSKIEIIVFVIEEGSPNAFGDKFVTKLGNKSSDSPNVVTNLVMNFVNYQTSASNAETAGSAQSKQKLTNMSLKWLQGFQLRSVSRACLCNTMQISSFNSVSINYAFPQ